MAVSSAVRMLSVACLVLSAAGMRRLGDCSSSADCGPSACCVVSFNRFSVPQCDPLGDLGAWCRIMNPPRELDLAYPNGLQISVRDAYRGMCPCRPGLICSRATSTCQLPRDSTQYQEDNSVSED
ncbi:astakine-like isoform X2 [Penaeus japonicus]|uniref:Astakine n=1 Tax=Penaeus japonicus TaxID=27405 RepID=E3WCX2_PENJP|nr:astakine-like isoform X2 [Penaeus japonicus]BAJ34645.1 astakine [Penaeus japonicus]